MSINTSFIYRLEVPCNCLLLRGFGRRNYPVGFKHFSPFYLLRNICIIFKGPVKLYRIGISQLRLYYHIYPLKIFESLWTPCLIHNFSIMSMINFSVSHINLNLITSLFISTEPLIIFLNFKKWFTYSFATFAEFGSGISTLIFLLVLWHRLLTLR